MWIVINIIYVLLAVTSFIAGYKVAKQKFSVKHEASRVSENEDKKETFPIPRWVDDEHGNRKANPKYLEELAKKIRES